MQVVRYLLRHSEASAVRYRMSRGHDISIYSFELSLSSFRARVVQGQFGVRCGVG